MRDRIFSCAGVRRRILFADQRLFRNLDVAGDPFCRFGEIIPLIGRGHPPHQAVCPHGATERLMLHKSREGGRSRSTTTKRCDLC
jgi:hypothetical protein